MALFEDRATALAPAMNVKEKNHPVVASIEHVLELEPELVELLGDLREVAADRILPAKDAGLRKSRILPKHDLRVEELGGSFEGVLIKRIESTTRLAARKTSRTTFTFA